jgi:hypothetical protein
MYGGKEIMRKGCFATGVCAFNDNDYMMTLALL